MGHRDADARRATPGGYESDWTAVRRRRRRRERRRSVRRQRRGWAAVYASTLLGVGVGGAGLLARWSAPTTEWLPQVAAAALPVLGPASLPLAAAVGAAALRGRRFGGGLCAVALAVLFSGWVFRTGSPAAASPASDALRVMTLNVGATDGKEGDVAAYVERTQPDIILLQEASVKWGPYSSVAARIALLDGYTVLTDTTRRSVGPGRQVTVTRLPVVSHEVGFLAAAEATAGVFSRTVVRWGGGEVVVYNVHLRPFNPSVGWRWSRFWDADVWAQTPGNLQSFFAEQSVEGDALARRASAETLPTVVAGDFNSSPDQWSRGLLSRSFREVTGRWLPGATRPDETPLINVDGIFVSPALGVTSAEIGPVGLSDHRAVSAVLGHAR